MKKQLPKLAQKKNSKHFFRCSNVTTCLPAGKVKQFNNVLILAFILFLPTQLGKHFFLPFSYLSGIRTDYLAPTIYLTDIIVFLLILINLKSVICFLKKKQIIFILVLLFINVLFSRSIFVSIYRYIKTVEILSVGFLAYRTFLKDKLILLGFLVTGLVELTLSVFQLVNKRSLQGIFYFLGERYLNLSMPDIAKASINGMELLRPYGTFSHPNSLAGFYLLLYFLVLTNKKLNKFFILKYFSLFVFSILVFLSFSKIAIFTYLLLSVIYYLASIKRCRICRVSRLITIFVVGALFLQPQTDPLTIQKRIELIKNSLYIIIHYPVFGVGIGSYLVVQNQMPSKFFYFFNQPVHNIFLLFFAELGIPLGLFIFYKFFIFLKKLPPSTFYLLFSILITGFFDHYWLTLQQNFLLLGFIIGGLFSPRRLS